MASQLRARVLMHCAEVFRRWRQGERQTLGTHLEATATLVLRTWVEEAPPWISQRIALDPEQRLPRVHWRRGGR